MFRKVCEIFCVLSLAMSAEAYAGGAPSNCNWNGGNQAFYQLSSFY